MKSRTLRHFGRRFLAHGVGSALFVLALVACSETLDGESEDSDDCKEAQADWGNKTQHLGETCSAGSYGSCTTNYDDCLEGTCRYSDSANHEICTRSCTSDSECGGQYCREGVCQPAASCHSYCDGTCCCDYRQSSTDPTQCVQGSCSCAL